MNRTKLLYYAAVGWTVAIFIGCSIPGDGLPHAFTRSDKVMHLGIFMLFSILWRLAGYGVWRVLLAGALYGFLIEVWQGVMPLKRSFDMYDALADTVGALLGIAIVWLAGKVVRKS